MSYNQLNTLNNERKQLKNDLLNDPSNCKKLGRYIEVINILRCEVL